MSGDSFIDYNYISCVFNDLLQVVDSEGDIVCQKLAISGWKRYTKNMDKFKDCLLLLALMIGSFSIGYWVL
jgi:hypothetical protein